MSLFLVKACSVSHIAKGSLDCTPSGRTCWCDSTCPVVVSNPSSPDRGCSGTGSSSSDIACISSTLHLPCFLLVGHGSSFVKRRRHQRSGRKAFHHRLEPVHHRFQGRCSKICRCQQWCSC